MNALIESKESNTLLLKPLPKSIIGIAAKFLKKEIEKSKGNFYPGIEIDIQIATNTIAELSYFFKEKIKFNDWKYELFFIPDSNLDSISLELYVTKLNIKTKLCLMSRRYNFSSLYKRNSYMTSAKEFIEMFEIDIKETNIQIDDWNSICKETKPLFYDKPPTNLLMNKLSDYFYDTLWSAAQDYWDIYNDYGSDSLPIRAFEIFQAFDEITPIIFGRHREWRLDSDFLGNDEWGLLQIYLKHRSMPNMAFVLEEIEGKMWTQTMKASKVMDFYFHILQNIKFSMVQWNIFVDKNEIKGGRYKDEPTSIEKF